MAPTPQDEFFERLSGARDFGSGPGLTVHQTQNAWAAAGSRTGFVKFPWVPEHNSWLFHVSGSTPYLFPTPSASVSSRNTSVYTDARDGFEATASLFAIGDDHVGQVTLPTGSAVYASSGAGIGDGTLTVRNITMGGYAGLDGSRDYTTAEGTTTEVLPPKRPSDPIDATAARVDDFLFEPTTARYVRMQGERGNPTYGYSMFSFHVYGDDPDTIVDLALGQTATASSQENVNRGPDKVVDGDGTSRWAVAGSQRTNPNSWIQVDLGEETLVGGARLAWESSAGSRYHVQTSVDGVEWETQSTYGVANAADANVHRLDTVALTPAGADEPAPVETRYVRMQGVQGDPGYGYSLFHLRAFTPGAVDAAAGKPATASSNASGNAPGTVADGGASTRWAVANAERPRADSWIQVDLGAPTLVSEVQLGWEIAAGRLYLIQTSLDGETWTDSASFRFTGNQITSTDEGWVNVEDTAGFVVRGSEAPITVSRETDNKHAVRLVDAGATTTPFLVEMVPGDAATTAATAASARPTVGNDDVLATTLDGYLSLFNLTGSDITTTVAVPYTSDRVSLFEGTQELGESASIVSVTVPAGSAVVLPPRFEVPRDAAEGLTATVVDGATLELNGAGATSIDVSNLASGESRTVGVAENISTTARFDGVAPYPVQDLALSRLTFPASVLPVGMTSPGLAVDGDASTAWTPGTNGRMVVDLGAVRDIGSVAMVWDGPQAPQATVSVSNNGLDFEIVGNTSLTGVTGIALVDASARYVAVSTDWSGSDAGLTAFKILPPGVKEPVGPGSIEGELPAWRVGEPASGALTVSGHPAPELTVTAGALPAGVTLDPITGAFGGQPTAGGAFTFTVTASNGVGEESTRLLTGSVAKAAPVLRLTAAVVDGSSGTLTATLRDSSDTVLTQVAGTVEFFRGTQSGAPIGTVELSDGTSSLTVANLAPGSSTSFTARFTPGPGADTSYVTAVSNAATLTVPAKPVDPKPANPVSVSVPVLSKAKQAYGSVAKLRATVTTTVTGATAGKVTFTSGKKTLGTAPIRKVGKEYKATLRIKGNQARGTYKAITASLRTTDGTTVSSVASAAKLKVVKAAPKARPNVTAKPFRAGTRPTVVVKVPKLTNGRHAMGRIRVQVGTKTVATVKLTKKNKGKVTVRLPRTYSSTVKVRAQYLPKYKETTSKSKWSKKTTVRVRR